MHSVQLNVTVHKSRDWLKIIHKKNHFRVYYKIYYCDMVVHMIENVHFRMHEILYMLIFNIVRILTVCDPETI